MLWHKIQGAGGTGANGPALVDATTYYGNPNSDTVTLTTPTHAVGDLLVALLSTRDNGSQDWTPPAGWTMRANGDATVRNLPSDAGIFFKIAGVSEPATFDFVISRRKTPMGGTLLSFSNATTVAWDVTNYIAEESDLNPAASLTLSGLPAISDRALTLGWGVSYGRDSPMASGDCAFSTGTEYVNVVDNDVARLITAVAEFPAETTSLTWENNGTIVTEINFVSSLYIGTLVAPEVIGATSTSTAGATLTLTMPTGVEEGDLLLVFGGRSGGNLSGPAGYTQIIDGNTHASYYKIATASEPTTVDITFENAGAWGSFVVVRGGEYEANQDRKSTDGTVRLGSLNPTEDLSLALYWLSAESEAANPYTLPGGITEVTSITSGNGGTQQVVSQVLDLTPTSDVNVPMSATVPALSHAILIKPVLY